MRMVVLIENLADSAGKLINEHGLSLYIEVNDVCILFDTGRTDAFIQNAEMLGINIADIDMVVLSHGHNDHCGGLPAFFQNNDKAIAYIAKAATADLFFQFACIKHKINIDQEIYTQYSDRIIYAENCMEIAKDVFIITNFNTGCCKRNFLKKIDGNDIADTFDHELAMIVRSSDGLVIFTGCSHGGVSNIISTVRHYFPNEKIKALVGGFHLARAPRFAFLGCSRSKVSMVSDIVANTGIKYVYTGHCTGKSAYNKLKSIHACNVEYLAIGAEFHL